MSSRISIMEDPTVEVRRKHKWVAISTYVLSDDQARRSSLGVAVTLSEDMLFSRIGPLCYFCGGDYVAVKSDPCPAEIANDSDAARRIEINAAST
jgi:hypothetical protein